MVGVNLPAQRNSKGHKTERRMMGSSLGRAALLKLLQGQLRCVDTDRGTAGSIFPILPRDSDRNGDGSNIGVDGVEQRCATSFGDDQQPPVARYQSIMKNCPQLRAEGVEITQGNKHEFV
eukprot:SAG11_NODE_3899_length_2158_cov_2.615347_3_plen_120_part_00